MLVFDENNKIKVMTMQEHKNRLRQKELELADSVQAMSKK